MPYADPDVRREKNRAYMQAWRERNPERNKQLSRESAQRRRAAGLVDDHSRLERMARYRRTEKGQQAALRSMRAYRARHPEKINWRRKADPEYVSILLADPCSYCGRAAGELDHIDPGSDHGNHNLTAACRSCNARKSNRRLLDFLAS